jgi:hypothetical protein
MDFNNGTVHLDVSTLQFLVYTVLPFIADLVTKRFADARVKTGVLTLLAVGTVLIQDAIQENGDIQVATLLGKLVTALVTAYITHTYVWKPLHITGDRGAILKSVPVGIGNVDPAKVALHEKRVGGRAA